MIAEELDGLVAQVLASPLVASASLAMGGTIFGAWLLGALWAFQDTARRSRSLLARYLAATWILVSGPVLLPLALGVYRLVRPADPADLRDYQRLVEILQTREAAASSCPDCRGRVDAGWRRCPGCRSWLARACERCTRWTPRDAAICPWCAFEPAGTSGAATPPVPIERQASPPDIALRPRVWHPASTASPSTVAAAPNVGRSIAPSPVLGHLA